MRRTLALVLLLVAWSAAEPPAAAVSANERGIAHLTGGRPEQAVACFREARQLLPEDGPEEVVVARNLAAALAALAERRLQGRQAEEAIGMLREARELHPTRIRYRVLLARAYLATGREPGRFNARDELVAVLEADPDHLAALLQLASIDYVERRLEDGTDRLEHALTLRPGDQLVTTQFERMRTERDVERNYDALESAAFIVRHSERISRRRAASVLETCERAWGELRTRFGHYPDGRIVVTLYPPSEFREATRLHGWVAGVSDGSIRLTLDDITREESLAGTIRHELAHHIIRDYAPRTPVWLHEGLAQLAEGRDGAGAAERFRSGDPPKAADLDRRILREPDPRRVAEYYALALAFTHYLQQLQGDRGIQALLRALDPSRSFDDACRIAFGKTRDELFDAWRDTIRPH